MAPPPDRFVEGLLGEARLIADYCRYSGCLPDRALFAAIAEVEALPDRRTDHPAVVRLQQTLHDISAVVSFSTQAKLRRTGNALRVKMAETRQALLVVGVSILLMVITGSLTIVHNKGVSIVRELEALASLPAGRTYVQMLWDVTQARGNVLVDPDDDQPTTSDLAVQGYLDDVYDLRALSERLSTASATTSHYLTYDVPFPLPGQRWAYCRYLEGRQALLSRRGDAAPSGAVMAATAAPTAVGPTTAGPDTAAGAAQVAAQPDATRAALSLVATKRSRYCEVAAAGGIGAASEAAQPRRACEAGLEASLASLNSRLSSAAGQGGEDGPSAQAASFLDQMELTAGRLTCAGSHVFSPGNIRDFRAQIGIVHETVERYALWLLPAFYGAVGAVIFHLRRMLNPSVSTPPLARLVHRVILGSLAGVVLSWFFTPQSALGGGISDVGFTLFGLAFLFGFSLDIFFAILDRFVAVAVAAIERVGTLPPAGPGTAARPVDAPAGAG